MKKIFLFLLFSGVAFAKVKEPTFNQLLDGFVNYLGGNSGKIISLIGFAGTFVVYMMTHKGSVLFIGIFLSMLLGGFIGILSLRGYEVGYAIGYGSAILVVLVIYNIILMEVLEYKRNIFIKKKDYL